MVYMYRTVMNMYDGEKWRWRVRNMSDNQIMAIFYKHLERREAAKNVKKRTETVKKTISTPVEPEFTPKQLSFF